MLDTPVRSTHSMQLFQVQIDRAEWMLRGLQNPLVAYKSLKLTFRKLPFNENPTYNPYTCIYLYIYICLFICLFVYLSFYFLICIYIYMILFIFIFTCIFEFVYIYIYNIYPTWTLICTPAAAQSFQNTWRFARKSCTCRPVREAPRSATTWYPAGFHWTSVHRLLRYPLRYHPYSKPRSR